MLTTTWKPGAAGHDEFSVGENVGAVSDFETLHNILLDQKHGDAVAIDAFDEREKFLDEQRRETQ